MNQSFYDTLAVDIARVITIGPRAAALLQVIEDPWDEESGELLPPAFQTPPQRPANITDWHIATELAARKPFQPHWDEILVRVRGREFATQKQLAATYGKLAEWVTKFKKVAIAQKVITKDEWERCFSGSKGNRAEKRTKAATTNQHLTNKEK